MTFGPCKNCAAALSGRYCANCGQAADVHLPSTAEMIHEALEGLTHSDSRIWRTLTWLWFRPGKLTQEFLMGRRVSSLPPFRLYLIISIGFFLAIALFHDRKLAVVRVGNVAESPVPVTEGGCDEVAAAFGSDRYPGWNQRLKRACTEIRRDNGAGLQKNLTATLPKAMFVFLPLIAFLHMLLYWRPRRRYAEQLLFFLHLQAFFFSAGLLMVLAGGLADGWPPAAGVMNALQALLGLSLPLYTVLALRRVFGQGWALTLVKSLVLCIEYVILALLTWLGVFLVAALEL